MRTEYPNLCCLNLRDVIVLREGHGAASQSCHSNLGGNLRCLSFVSLIFCVSRKKMTIARPWPVINFEPLPCRVII